MWDDSRQSVSDWKNIFSPNAMAAPCAIAAADTSLLERKFIVERSSPSHVATDERKQFSPPFALFWRVSVPVESRLTATANAPRLYAGLASHDSIPLQGRRKYIWTGIDWTWLADTSHYHPFDLNFDSHGNL